MSLRDSLSALLLLAALGACDPFSPRGAVRERMAARTAEAALAGIRADTVEVYDDGKMVPDVRHDVWYRFEVDGVVREDSLKRTLYVAGEEYKVCYDPRDPSNSTIELADIACGRVY